MIPNDFSKNIFKYQLIILVGIFVALAGLLTYSGVYQLGRLIDGQQPAMVNGQPSLNKSQPGTRIINGEPVGTDEENLWPVTVSIDNHPDARPTYGLGQAAVVYELPTEGGSTRFLALFTPGKETINKADKIGPVRSIRPYFLPIAKEYDALLAHSGGSAQALAQIETLKVNNLEEIAWWGPEYFWRVYSRSAPHNLFTSTEKLEQAIIDWKLNDQTPAYRPWLFDNNLNNNFKLKRAEKIAIIFSADKEYNVDWKYSTSTNNYARWQNGQAYRDELTNAEVRADNILIQFVPAEEVLDTVGRLGLEMTGVGKLWLFRDGAQIEGSWRKSSPGGRTIFYDAAGSELALKPGKIWIEVVPGEGQIAVE